MSMKNLVYGEYGMNLHCRLIKSNIDTFLMLHRTSFSSFSKSAGKTDFRDDVENRTHVYLTKLNK